MTHATHDSSAVVVLNSPFGWFGLRGDDSAVGTVVFGHASAAEVHERLQSTRRRSAPDLLRDAAAQIARYLEGEPIDLGGIPIDFGRPTAFQARVRRALRRVPYGETVTYAELAARAGAPRAARAVGTVMATNPVPLLIPCHRVVGTGGRLGGFSAPQGLAMKRALLSLEAGLPEPLAELRRPCHTARAMTHLR